MKSVGCQVSFCSRCRFYTPEGRRGGRCSQLGVPVEGRWIPCSQAVPVFEPSLEGVKPHKFLPQPVALSFSDIQLEADRLEATLEASAVSGCSSEAALPQPVRIPITH